MNSIACVLLIDSKRHIPFMNSKLPLFISLSQIINNDTLSKHTTLNECSVRTTYIMLMSSIDYIIGSNAAYSKP